MRLYSRIVEQIAQTYGYRRFFSQAAAQAEFGPQFETTFDHKTADFALALGTFYCRHLKAPIIAEVRREGVVFAHVYDLRGGPTPQLLTLPPP
jgi:hypothetical protein